MVLGASPTRVAATLLNRHGQDADARATAAAGEAIKRGDDKAAEDWKEVGAAIRALQAIGNADMPTFPHHRR
jgi:hypothetical protein